MANFGNENIESGWRNISNDGANGLSGTRFTLPEAGTITSITCYLGLDSGSGNYQYALYRPSDGVLLGVSAPAAFPGGGAYGWRTENLITPYVAAAGDYVLCAWSNPTSGAYTKYDTGTGVFWFDPTPGTWPTLDDPFNGPSPGTGKVSIYATYTASNDISVPLTGVAGTASIGAVVLSLMLLLTGVSTNPTRQISGVVGAGSVGAVTAQVGVGADITRPLTGVSANPAYPLSGVAGTGGVGNVAVFAGNDIALPLTGISGIGSVGTVVYFAGGGEAATGEVGSVSPRVSPPLTANEATAAVGSAVPSRSLGLNGVGASGEIGGWGMTAIPITGTAGAGEVGTLVPRIAPAITGNPATAGIGAVTQAPFVALSGVEGIGAVSRDLLVPLAGIVATGSVGALSCRAAVPTYVNVSPRKRIIDVAPRKRIIDVFRRRS